MPAPGAILADRYRILGPLGAGGMATVHRGRDERLERDVAIKILLPNHAGDPLLAARFEREARSLAAAAHPGVVAVYDVDPGDPAAGVEPFFVMELCPGGSLADRLAGGRRVSPDELVPILISVADGLAGLHAAGIVHRDVKPSNILLAPTRAKLADFGLARSDDASQPSDLTAPGTAVGTLGYLAPDVLAGGVAGPPADVYALGVAAFAGLTGSMPRGAGTLAELVASADSAAPLVSSVAPDLGTAFDEPIAAALDPHPAKRPDALSFAASMTTALGRWSRARLGPAVAIAAPPDVDATTVAAEIQTNEPPPAVGPTSPSARPERSSSPLAGIAAAALIAAVIIAALALAVRPPAAGGPGTSPTSGAAASIDASPTDLPSPSPSPSPTPPPTPVPTLSVADRALAALDGVDEAINAARGGGGLKGKEANDLERRASAVRSALVAGDLDAAAAAADELSEEVDDVADEMDDDVAARIENAVIAVVDILREG